MSGKKGMKKYPEGIREVTVSWIGNGENQRAMNREYGISRYAIIAMITLWLRVSSPSSKPNASTDTN